MWFASSSSYLLPLVDNENHFFQLEQRISQQLRLSLMMMEQGGRPQRNDYDTKKVSYRFSNLASNLNAVT